MRRRLPLFRPLLAVTATLFVCGLGLLFLVKIDRIVPAPGLLTGASYEVRAPRDGIVQAVLVKPGERIPAAQAVVQLDKSELETRAAALGAEIEAQQAELDAAVRQRQVLEHDVHPAEMEKARAEARAAELKLSHADEAAQAAKKLLDMGLASVLQASEIELDRKLAGIAAEDARRAIPLLESRHRDAIDGIASRVTQLQREIEEKRIQRDEALKAIRDSTVRAPVEGVVTTGRLSELRGKLVHAGDEVMRLARGGPGLFEGTISDTGRAVVRPGQPVKIRLDGYPWLIYGTLAGKVTRVSERREGSEGFPVEIAVDGSAAPGPIREGMRGIARISVGERVSIIRILVEDVSGHGRP